jgi:hypothetical protein
MTLKAQCLPGFHMPMSFPILPLVVKAKPLAGWAGFGLFILCLYIESYF